MCDYSNFTLHQIEDANGLQWGGTSLYTDGIFPTEDGRARLHNVPRDSFTEQPDSNFDFIFNTGRTVEHWHTAPIFAKGKTSGVILYATRPVRNNNLAIDWVQCRWLAWFCRWSHSNSRASW